MTMLAPGRLSTTNGWPRRWDIFSEAMRPATSLVPPGANGTMSRIGRSGKLLAPCARHAPATSRPAAIAVIRGMTFMRCFLLVQSRSLYWSCRYVFHPGLAGAGQYFGHLDPAAFSCRLDARAQHGERPGGRLAAHLGLALAAHCVSEFVHLFAYRIVFFARHPVRALGAALEEAQPLVQVVERARLLAVDIHAVVLRGRSVTGIERGERAALV